MGRIAQKILVVKNRALGDAVIGLASVQYLKSSLPECEVHYAVPGWIAPFFDKIEHSADKIISFNSKGLGDYFNFFKQIKREGYRYVFELHQSGRLKTFFNLTGVFGAWNYFYHNHNLRSGNFIFDQGVRKPIIQRELDGVYSFAKTINPDVKYPNYLDYSPEVKVRDENLGKSDIIFGIVATREDKKWPLSHYLDLAQELNQKHGYIIHIPLSKASEDQNLKNEILKRNFHFIKIVEERLSDLPLRISGAGAYIGNDTGLKHIAASLGIKTATFFGPEEPIEWHPYNLEKNIYFWIHGHDIRSEMNLICALKQFDTSKSLKELKVSEVLPYLESFIQTS